MTAGKDLTGGRFGRWTVEHRVPTPKLAKSKWVCICDCGTRGEVLQNNLVSGISKSCGCLGIEKLKSRPGNHGFGTEPLAQVWRDIKKRCLNPRCKSHKNYGGRGIKLADEWLDYLRFRADVGPSPGAGYSLDRIDNDGNYEPGNVRWATWEEQATNKRSSLRLTCRGETLTASQWAKKLGVPKLRILWRYHAGWPVEAALFLPPGSKNPGPKPA